METRKFPNKQDHIVTIFSLVEDPNLTLFKKHLVSSSNQIVILKDIKDTYKDN